SGRARGAEARPGRASGLGAGEDRRAPCGAWGILVVVGIAVSVGSLGEATFAQAFLGASGADLVYTPVTPCRIINTRAAGAYPGACTWLAGANEYGMSVEGRNGGTLTPF